MATKEKTKIGGVDISELSGVSLKSFEKLDPIEFNDITDETDPKSDDEDEIGVVNTEDDTEAEFDADGNPKDDEQFQGTIRDVTGARLVYKRKGTDGMFEELWIYNSNNLFSKIAIKEKILSGTDIPASSSGSGKGADGTQEYSEWITGDCIFLLIRGLPN